MSETIPVKAPWLAFRGEVPATLDYPDCSMAQAVEQAAELYPDKTAYVFMGKKTTYKAMVESIHTCARARTCGASAKRL